MVQQQISGGASRPASAPHGARRAAALAISPLAAVLAVILLAALHLVRPDLDPGYTVVSQYALGAHGWMMGAVFAFLAVACVLLASGVPPARLRRPGRAGRVLLVVAAAGLVIALVFVVGHPLHEVGSLLGNAGLALAAVLLGRDLRRGTPDRERGWSAAAAHAPWIAAVLMAALLATGVWGFGLVNRLIVLAYVVWLIVAARQAARMGTDSVSRR